MNELTTTIEQLPDTLEDLTQFVLVGKAKLQAYMLKLKTVNKLSTAQSIRDQALKEAQEINEAVKAAEIRIGEILLAIPKATAYNNPSGKEGTQNRDTSKLGKTKSETAAEMGYSKDDVSYYQQMANNPEVVKAVLTKARENGEIATKSDIQKAIKEAKQEQAETIRDLKEERDYLESQVEELKNADPVTVEVVPDDYEDLKQKVKLYKTQAKSAEDARKKSGEQYRKELEEAKQRIKDLETRKGISELQKKLEEETEYFAIRTYNYIQQNGGYVWITERMEQLPEDKRKTFINTIHAIDAFSKQMIQNIGGYSVE